MQRRHIMWGLQCILFFCLLTARLSPVAGRGRGRGRVVVHKPSKVPPTQEKKSTVKAAHTNTQRVTTPPAPPPDTAVSWNAIKDRDEISFTNPCLRFDGELNSVYGDEDSTFMMATGATTTDQTLAWLIAPTAADWKECDEQGRLPSWLKANQLKCKCGSDLCNPTQYCHMDDTTGYCKNFPAAAKNKGENKVDKKKFILDTLLGKMCFLHKISNKFSSTETSQTNIMKGTMNIYSGLANLLADVATGEYTLEDMYTTNSARVKWYRGDISKTYDGFNDPKLYNLGNERGFYAVGEKIPQLTPGGAVTDPKYEKYQLATDVLEDLEKLFLHTANRFLNPMDVFFYIGQATRYAANSAILSFTQFSDRSGDSPFLDVKLGCGVKDNQVVQCSADYMNPAETTFCHAELKSCTDEPLKQLVAEPILTVTELYDKLDSGQSGYTVHPAKRTSGADNVKAACGNQICDVGGGAYGSICTPQGCSKVYAEKSLHKGTLSADSQKLGYAVDPKCPDAEPFGATVNGITHTFARCVCDSTNTPVTKCGEDEYCSNGNCVKTEPCQKNNAIQDKCFCKATAPLVNYTTGETTPQSPVICDPGFRCFNTFNFKKSSDFSNHSTVNVKQADTLSAGVTCINANSVAAGNVKLECTDNSGVVGAAEDCFCGGYRTDDTTGLNTALCKQGDYCYREGNKHSCLTSPICAETQTGAPVSEQCSCASLTDPRLAVVTCEIGEYCIETHAGEPKCTGVFYPPRLETDEGRADLKTESTRVRYLIAGSETYVYSNATVVPGCRDKTACNYQPTATFQPESGEYACKYPNPSRACPTASHPLGECIISSRDSGAKNHWENSLRQDRGWRETDNNICVDQFPPDPMSGGLYYDHDVDVKDYVALPSTFPERKDEYNNILPIVYGTRKIFPNENQAIYLHGCPENPGSFNGVDYEKACNKLYKGTAKGWHYDLCIFPPPGAECRGSARTFQKNFWIASKTSSSLFKCKDKTKCQPSVKILPRDPEPWCPPTKCNYLPQTEKLLEFAENFASNVNLPFTSYCVEPLPGKTCTNNLILPAVDPTVVQADEIAECPSGFKHVLNDDATAVQCISEETENNPAGSSIAQGLKKLYNYFDDSEAITQGRAYEVDASDTRLYGINMARRRRMYATTSAGVDQTLQKVLNQEITCKSGTCHINDSPPDLQKTRDYKVERDGGSSSVKREFPDDDVTDDYTNFTSVSDFVNSPYKNYVKMQDDDTNTNVEYPESRTRLDKLSGDNSGSVTILNVKEEAFAEKNLKDIFTEADKTKLRAFWADERPETTAPVESYWDSDYYGDLWDTDAGMPKNPSEFLWRWDPKKVITENAYFGSDSGADIDKKGLTCDTQKSLYDDFDHKGGGQSAKTIVNGCKDEGNGDYRDNVHKIADGKQYWENVFMHETNTESVEWYARQASGWSLHLPNLYEQVRWRQEIRQHKPGKYHHSRTDPDWESTKLTPGGTNLEASITGDFLKPRFQALLWDKVFDYAPDDGMKAAVQSLVDAGGSGFTEDRLTSTVPLSPRGTSYHHNTPDKMLEKIKFHHQLFEKNIEGWEGGLAHNDLYKLSIPTKRHTANLTKDPGTQYLTGKSQVEDQLLCTWCWEEGEWDGLAWVPHTTTWYGKAGEYYTCYDCCGIATNNDCSLVLNKPTTSDWKRDIYQPNIGATYKIPENYYDEDVYADSKGYAKTSTLEFVQWEQAQGYMRFHSDHNYGTQPNAKVNKRSFPGEAEKSNRNGNVKITQTSHYCSGSTYAAAVWIVFGKEKNCQEKQNGNYFGDLIYNGEYNYCYGKADEDRGWLVHESEQHPHWFKSRDTHQQSKNTNTDSHGGNVWTQASGYTEFLQIVEEYWAEPITTDFEVRYHANGKYDSSNEENEAPKRDFRERLKFVLSSTGYERLGYDYVKDGDTNIDYYNYKTDGLAGSNSVWKDDEWDGNKKEEPASRVDKRLRTLGDFLNPSEAAADYPPGVFKGERKKHGPTQGQSGATEVKGEWNGCRDRYYSKDDNKKELYTCEAFSEWVDRRKNDIASKCNQHCIQRNYPSSMVDIDLSYLQTYWRGQYGFRGRVHLGKTDGKTNWNFEWMSPNALPDGGWCYCYEQSFHAESTEGKRRAEPCPENCVSFTDVCSGCGTGKGRTQGLGEDNKCVKTATYHESTKANGEVVENWGAYRSTYTFSCEAGTQYRYAGTYASLDGGFAFECEYCPVGKFSLESFPKLMNTERKYAFVSEASTKAQPVAWSEYGNWKDTYTDWDEFYKPAYRKELMMPSCQKCPIGSEAVTMFPGGWRVYRQSDKDSDASHASKCKPCKVGWVDARLAGLSYADGCIQYPETRLKQVLFKKVSTNAYPTTISDYTEDLTADHSCTKYVDAPVTKSFDAAELCDTGWRKEVTDMTNYKFLDFVQWDSDLDLKSNNWKANTHLCPFGFEPYFGKSETNACVPCQKGTMTHPILSSQGYGACAVCPDGKHNPNTNYGKTWNRATAADESIISKPFTYRIPWTTEARCKHLANGESFSKKKRTIAHSASKVSRDQDFCEFQATANIYHQSMYVGSYYVDRNWNNLGLDYYDEENLDYCEPIPNAGSQSRVLDQQATLGYELSVVKSNTVGSTYEWASLGPAVSCPTGKFADEKGEYQDYFDENYNPKECKDCAAGKYRGRTQPGCTKCDKGYYNDEKGQEICKVCPRGHFTRDSTGYAPWRDAQSNKEFIPKTLKTDGPNPSDRTACQQCVVPVEKPGHDEKNRDGTNCWSCAPGRYYTTELSNLARGLFDDNTLTDDDLANRGVVKEHYCRACEPGRWQNDMGESKCTMCPAGKAEFLFVAPKYTRHHVDNTVTVSRAILNSETTLWNTGNLCSTKNGVACISPANTNKKNDRYHFQIDSNVARTAVNAEFIIAQGVTKPRNINNYVTDSELTGSAWEVDEDAQTAVKEFSFDDDNWGPMSPRSYDQCHACPPGYYQDEKGQTWGRVTFVESRKRTFTAVDTVTVQQHQASGVNYPGATVSMSFVPNFHTPEDRIVEKNYYKTTLLGCKECPLGKYGEGTGVSTNLTSACMDCPEGWSTGGDAGSFRCEPCTPGKYSNSLSDTGRDDCWECPTGFGNNNHQSNSCAQCAAGRFSASGICTDCPAGFFQNEPEQGECIACHKGRYSNTRRSTGVYVQVNATHTQYDCGSSERRMRRLSDGRELLVEVGVCVPGYSTVSDAATSQNDCMVACPMGTFAYKMGCEVCPAGYYNNLLAQASCKQCPRGTFQSRERQYACTTCEGGFETAAGGTQTVADCVYCVAGKIKESTVRWRGDRRPRIYLCKDVEAGLHAPNDGMGKGIICPSGDYSDVPGLSQCKKCEAGKFQDNRDTPDRRFKSITESCTLCPAGRWTDQLGRKTKLECTACAAGKYSYDKGQVAESTCQDCKVGFYSKIEAQKVCRKCDMGAYGDEVGAPECKVCEEGKYSDEYARTDSSACKQCAAGSIGKPGGGAISCDMCMQGWGHVPEHNNCSECNSADGVYNDATSPPVSRGGLCKTVSCPDGMGFSTEKATAKNVGDNIDGSPSAFCVNCPTGWFKNEQVRNGVGKVDLCTEHTAYDLQAGQYIYASRFEDARVFDAIPCNGCGKSFCFRQMSEHGGQETCQTTNGVPDFDGTGGGRCEEVSTSILDSRSIVNASVQGPMCTETRTGCGAREACNYDATVTLHDEEACNYAAANTHCDGTCHYGFVGTKCQTYVSSDASRHIGDVDRILLFAQVKDLVQQTATEIMTAISSMDYGYRVRALRPYFVDSVRAVQRYKERFIAVRNIVLAANLAYDRPFVESDLGDWFLKDTLVGIRQKLYVFPYRNTSSGDKDEVWLYGPDNSDGGGEEKTEMCHADSTALDGSCITFVTTDEVPDLKYRYHVGCEDGCWNVFGIRRRLPGTRTSYEMVPTLRQVSVRAGHFAMACWDPANSRWTKEETHEVGDTYVCNEIPYDIGSVIAQQSGGCYNPPARPNRDVCNDNPNGPQDVLGCVYSDPYKDCSGNCKNNNINPTNDKCDEEEIPGCTKDTYCNYNPLATYDSGGKCMSKRNWLFQKGLSEDQIRSRGSFLNCNGECVNNLKNPLNSLCDEEEVDGCTHADACNFDPTATFDDRTCYFSDKNNGAALHFRDLTHRKCDGSCINDNVKYSATDINGEAGSDGTCDEEQLTCLDWRACNFDHTVHLQPYKEPVNSLDECVYPYDSETGALLNMSIYTCRQGGTIRTAGGFCQRDSDGDGVCDELEISGCGDSTACNFDASATDNDMAACTRPSETYLNCDGSCVVDSVLPLKPDGSSWCEGEYVYGCTQNTSCTYNPLATHDNAALPCEFAGQGRLKYRDCNGVCASDARIPNNGLCDEEETAACLATKAPSACNAVAASSGTYHDANLCIYESATVNCEGDRKWALASLQGTTVDLCKTSGRATIQIEWGTITKLYKSTSSSCTGSEGRALGTNNDTDISANSLAAEKGAGSFYLTDCAGLSFAVQCTGTYGCMTQTACTYDADATQHDDMYCEENDYCNVCGGTTFGGDSHTASSGCDRSFYEGCLDTTACPSSISSTAKYNNPSLCTYDGVRNCNGDCYEDDDNDNVCNQEEVQGCTRKDACNYNALATFMPSTDLCEMPYTHSKHLYRDCSGNCVNNTVNPSNNLCDEEEIYGCDLTTACNYNPNRTVDDNSLCKLPDCKNECNGEETGIAVQDKNGACCYRIDCENVCGGPAELDCNGVCGGNSTFTYTLEYTTLLGTTSTLTLSGGVCCEPSERDCANVCFGSATRDAVGRCEGSCQSDLDGDGSCDDEDMCPPETDSSGNYVDGSGIIDCNNECGGGAVLEGGICCKSTELDCFGVCNGNGTEYTLVGETKCCAGLVTSANQCCDIDQVADKHGVCCASSSIDCDSVCGGGKDRDVCGVCGGAGFPTGACDCDGRMWDKVGECGGSCSVDADGDGTCDDSDPCVGTFDCAGVCNGKNTLDASGDCCDNRDCTGACGGNTTVDCTGVCGGSAYYDCRPVCINPSLNETAAIDSDGDGVCDADEIYGCFDETACNYDKTVTEARNEDCTYSNQGTFVWYACPVEGAAPVLLDTDSDGTPDRDEVKGCQQAHAANSSTVCQKSISASATDHDETMCAYPTQHKNCDDECIHGDADNDGVCDSQDVCATTATCNSAGTSSCTDTTGGNGFVCNCKNHWSGTICDQKDSCVANDITCANGQFDSASNRVDGCACTCIAGYTGAKCDVDVDECSQENNKCKQGVCAQGAINTYTCTCYNGFEQNTNCDVCGSGMGWNGVNGTGSECSTCVYPQAQHSTDPYAKCEDQKCLPGYGLKQQAGFDPRKNPDSNENCVQCLATEASPGGLEYCQTMVCPANYKLKSSPDRTLRYDHTDNCEPRTCDDDGFACQNNGVLSGNAVDGCTCNCANTGYEGNKCLYQINECCTDVILPDWCNNNNRHSCENGGVCVDQIGTTQYPKGHSCNCAGTGYEGDLCQTNINECQTGHLCENGGVCVDQIGTTQYPNGHSCDCTGTGYGGLYCTDDIDECTSSGVNKHDCHAQATCSNTQGSFTCACNSGWTGNGTSCTDINECTSSGVNKHDCDDEATCTNTPGGFTCACNPGWTGDGKSCADIDECPSGDNTHQCGHGGSCVNAVDGFKNHSRGYTCDCANTGWKGDLCQTNINECPLGVDTHECEHGGECVDVDGFTNSAPDGYTCNCAGTGYEGDRCQTEINECCDTSPQNQWCHSNSHTCVRGSCVNADNGFQTVSVGHTCNCTGTGYEGDTCEDDINECQTGHLCENGGKCVDKDGFSYQYPNGHSCDCTGTGYGGLYCTDDIDECTSSGVNKHDCHAQATCSNTQGSFTCACNSGWTGSGKQCEDFKECDNSAHHTCNARQNCVETPGSFTCTCKPEYVLDSNGDCADINECTSSGVNKHDCDDEATCTNTPGGFTCACNPGWTGDGKNCVDVDECATNNGDCNQDQQCFNLVGNVNAHCEEKACLVSDLNCEHGQLTGDIVFPTQWTAVGDITRGTANCDCGCQTNGGDPGGSSDGFTERSTAANGHAAKSCTVCPAGDGWKAGKCVQCENGEVNDQDTYTAECATLSCDPGYGITSDANWDHTKDSTVSDNCVACVNSTTSLGGQGQCAAIVCQSGYKPKPEADLNRKLGFDSVSNCENIDECNDADFLHNCHANATCSDTTPGFQCACNQPYWEGNGVSCTDVNECATNNGGCEPHENCVNNAGSPPTCVDINECDNHQCANNATCNNLQGSYSCNCPPGWEGPLCADSVQDCLPETVTIWVSSGNPGKAYTFHSADSCNNDNSLSLVLLSAHTTYVFKRCGNSQEHPFAIKPPNAVYTSGITESSQLSVRTGDAGSNIEWKCTSHPASMTGTFTVVPIDKCVRGTCVDAHQSFSCECGTTGYNGDRCQNNIDDCPGNNCQNGATCVDGVKGYTCTCADGYDGTYCDNNINECAANPCNSKHSAAVCTDLVNGYECICANTGYSGADCDEEIDECVGNPCGKNANCTNQVGFSALYYKGYSCDCTGTGYDGYDCENQIDECDRNPNSCVNGDCIDKDGTTQYPDGYTCDCAGTGYEGTYCGTDINECTRNTHDCHAHATCDNNDGGFTCACKSGYNGNGKNCTDVKECIGNGSCNNITETCVELSGSHRCDCKPGFHLYNGACADINECNNNPCANGLCVNAVDGFNTKPSGYTCDCTNTGWTGNLCQTNINECQSPNTHECLNGGTCVDVGGFTLSALKGYTCDCAAGYTGDTCETNIDECATNPCKNGGTCKDGINSYNCTCAAGYSGSTCETNIDECAPNPCKNGGTCKDGINSYTCTCAAGYSGSTCETNIDECATNPCKNGGTCKDGIDSYDCTCAGNWRGATCEESTACPADYCRNGGTCTSSAGVYDCTCANGFEKNPNDGNKCTVCPAGMGWNRVIGAGSKCLVCDDQHANNLATEQAECALQRCPAGYGTATDASFSKSRDPQPALNTVSDNCVACTGNTVSGETVGVCKQVACSPKASGAEMIPKDNINLVRTYEYDNQANCKCRYDKESNGICDEDETYKCRLPAACNFDANEAFTTADNLLCEYAGDPSSGLSIPNNLKFADCSGNCFIGFTRENNECKVEENKETGIAQIRQSTNDTVAKREALVSYFEGLVEADASAPSTPSAPSVTVEERRYENRIPLEIEDVKEVMPTPAVNLLEQRLQEKLLKAQIEHNLTNATGAGGTTLPTTPAPEVKLNLVVSPCALLQENCTADDKACITVDLDMDRTSNDLTQYILKDVGCWHVLGRSSVGAVAKQTKLANSTYRWDCWTGSEWDNTLTSTLAVGDVYTCNNYKFLTGSAWDLTKYGCKTPRPTSNDRNCNYDSTVDIHDNTCRNAIPGYDCDGVLVDATKVCITSQCTSLEMTLAYQFTNTCSSGISANHTVRAGQCITPGCSGSQLSAAYNIMKANSVC